VRRRYRIVNLAFARFRFLTAAERAADEFIVTGIPNA
jgi:hypothetical protein